MSVTFQKGIASQASLTGSICSICKQKIHKNSETASHRVGAVYDTVHFNCMKHWLKDHDYCPICKHKISSLKERSWPKATSVANKILIISYAVLFGSLLTAAALVAKAPPGTPGPDSAGCVVPILVGAGCSCFAGMIIKSIVDCLEGTTFPPSDGVDGVDGGT